MVSSHSKSILRGTTLIELVVSMSLFVVLVGLSTTITIDAWRTYLSLSGQSALARSLLDAEDRLAQLLSTATATNSTTTIDGVTYTAGPTTIIATLSSVDSAGGALAGSTDTLVYTQTDEGLVEVLRVGGGSRRNHHQIVIGPALRSLQFTLTPTGGGRVQPTVTVQLTAEATVPSRVITRSTTRTIVLGNMP